MSISDKLTAVAENMQKVYDAGKAAGGGGDSYYDTFWDSFQQNGERTDYICAFHGSYCPMSIDAFKPKYSMYPRDCTNMFRQATFGRDGEPLDLAEQFEQLGIVLDTSSAINFTYWLYGANIRRVGVIACSTTADFVFYGATKLETVDKWIVTEKITEYSNAFGGAVRLKNITIEGTIARSVSFSESPLSKASIISVMDALSDTASGQTLTLKRTAVNTAFETATGLADGSISDEWLNLIATKANWSIVLS